MRPQKGQGVVYHKSHILSSKACVIAGHRKANMNERRGAPNFARRTQEESRMFRLEGQRQCRLRRPCA
eukprot:2971604-Rhodomonas_salina.1